MTRIAFMIAKTLQSVETTKSSRSRGRSKPDELDLERKAKVRGSSGVPELPRTLIFRAGLARPRLPRDWVPPGTGVTLPYLAAAFGVLSPLPGISGAVAFTMSPANFRWLVSSCSANS